MECQLIVAKRLGYLEGKDFEKLEDEVDKLGGMMMRFIKCVKDDVNEI